MNKCCITLCPLFDPYKPYNCSRENLLELNDCALWRRAQSYRHPESQGKCFYAKFTYTSDWRNVPADEVYPIWNDADLNKAAKVFKKRHKSDGALMVFKSEDGKTWEIMKDESPKPHDENSGVKSGNRE
jgi:hypothetical protein